MKDNETIHLLHNNLGYLRMDVITLIDLGGLNPNYKMPTGEIVEDLINRIKKGFLDYSDLLKKHIG